MKKFFIAFLLLIGFGISPVLIAFTGTGLASVFGCGIGIHAGPVACVVMGVDIGPTLSNMVMMHWLALASLPIAALGVLILLLIGLIAIIRNRIGKRAS